MGKKRRQNRRDDSGQPSKRDEQTNYHINEDFADSEDEFYAARDQILLEDGPRSKRQKLVAEDEFLQPSDEEVLGYDEDGSSAEDELENGDSGSDRDGLSRSNDGDDGDDEDNLRDWGTSKADYYNTDVIETEADALEEEQEARRLQQKQLHNLTEADFGFDKDLWIEEDTTSNEQRKDIVTERLPELEIKEDASLEEKNEILKSRYPEFGPLAKDFVGLHKLHEELALAAKAAEAVVKMKAPPGQSKVESVSRKRPVHKTPIATSKLRALSAYLGTIGMYFALLTSKTSPTSPKALAMSPAELRDHPVVQILLRSRQQWESIKDVAVPDLQTIAIEPDANSLGEAGPETRVNGRSIPTAITGEPVMEKESSRTTVERADIEAQQLAEAARKARMQKTEAKLAELDSLMSAKRKEARIRPTELRVGGDDSDFGDEEALTAQEAAEKARRKKTLRFYTSQIAQKSNKRGTASRDAGGDADLPYKERLKDRQARLLREAERRGRSIARKDEELGHDGSNDDVEDARAAKEVQGVDVDEDDYYNVVLARTKQKKDERKAFAEAQAQAARDGSKLYVEEQISPGGKRAITYAIAKNKGLVPRRRKEVRNPRVKKKIRFEQKMKKLGSIRQVYKGGEGRGGYGGELTGIKTNVLKGVKL